MPAKIDWSDREAVRKYHKQWRDSRKPNTEKKENIIDWENPSQMAKYKHAWYERNKDILRQQRKIRETAKKTKISRMEQELALFKQRYGDLAM